MSDAVNDDDDDDGGMGTRLQPSGGIGAEEDDEEADRSGAGDRAGEEEEDRGERQPSVVIKCTHTFVHGVRVNDLAVTPDGKTLVVICTERKVRFYDLNKLSEMEERQIVENETPTSLSLSADGNRLLVNISSASQPQIHAWDVHSSTLVNRYCGQRQIRFVIRSCFGGHEDMFVVSGSEDNNVYLWNRHSGELLATLQGHTKTVNSVSWCPAHPALFVSASDDNTIRVWGAAREVAVDSTPPP
eukprot:CAMPEP_0185848838 /NCGR_PEP_ID=MMETSP1354-20130828/3564_1 /TAXON_ID=708628 /ORGANISM="Erythrolobus madagascarensis, Strain CCMP3276" /LENGTH=243 /DNA_ID=CAMNT_0028549285 /DNA_START=11 /DNA_END=742 /DNA_ORIENTATION=+